LGGIILGPEKDYRPTSTSMWKITHRQVYESPFLMANNRPKQEQNCLEGISYQKALVYLSRNKPQEKSQSG